MSAPIDLAREANAAGDWEAALVHWREAAKLDPDGFWPAYWVAGSLARLERYRESIPLLQALARTAKGLDLCVVHQTLTENFLQLHDPSAALEHFRIADAMNLAEEKAMHRLAQWIISERLETGSPNDLPEDLLSKVMF